MAIQVSEGGNGSALGREAAAELAADLQIDMRLWNWRHSEPAWIGHRVLHPGRSDCFALVRHSHDESLKRPLMYSTLFLAWQDKDRTRAWFPVGRRTRIRTGGTTVSAIPAARISPSSWPGLSRADGLPDFRRDDRSKELFPMFKNRCSCPEGRISGIISAVSIGRRADPI